MNNKRRRRKTVLDLNSADGSNLDATSSQTFSKTNGSFGNSLTHLLQQYNSDSDDDVPQTDKKQCLNEKVNDFLAEIQCIAPNNDVSKDDVKTDQPKSVWQECFDEQTGYPYYWHVETNVVTWEIPEELELSRKNDGSRARPTSSKIEVSHNHVAKNYPLKLPPVEKVPKEVVKRHRHKESAAAHSVKRKKIAEEKDEDSDDGRIEMITSFGSDNTDSDKSDEDTETPDVQSQKNLKKSSHKSKALSSPPRPALQTTDDGDSLKTSVSNGDDCDEEDVSINDIPTEKPPRSGGDHDELKFSLVPGYADDSENEDNLSAKRRVEPLFPIVTSFENAWPVERTQRTDSVAEESGCSQPVEIQEAVSADDSRVVEKVEEPKTNKFLEGLGTSTKAFQRKKRIAFDVVMNKGSKVDSEGSSRSQSDSTPDPSQVIRGNEERFGLGFSKVSTDDADPISSSSEETSHVLPEKKDNSLGKASMSFVKGETLTLNQKNIPEADKKSWTQDTQMIAEKLKFLSEGSPMASAVQIMNIQLQTLLTAWEAGALKDSYCFNWLSSTSRELSRLEKAAAPSGWDCQWDQSQKRYYYRNEKDGETRWSYPDIIGGAEEMELCTTPPPPSELEDKEKSPELQTPLVRDSETQHERSHDEIKPDVVTNVEDKAEDADYTKADETDDITVEKVVNEPKSPTPPPPPRICAEDLKRDRKKRRDADRHKIVTKSSKKDESEEKGQDIKDTEDKDLPAKTEIILPEGEPAMPAVQIVNPLLLAPNSSHAEPLPPGVDQPEIPYAIAAATIEPSVLFSTAAQQANASIYAATMADPTNLSILGHHHPALVQNQLVHYPTYHSHLQNQAILAAANRLAGPDAVQFMLDYTRIYANSQVIAKPPVKMRNEALGTALDSFYNDIASLESQPVTDDPQPSNLTQATVLPVVVQPQQSSVSMQPESQQVDSKDKKKKKVKIVISKKQKQVSSMVAKWKKAQNYEGTN